MGKEINTWCELDSTVAEFARFRNRLCKARTLVSSATCQTYLLLIFLLFVPDLVFVYELLHGIQWDN